VTESAVSLLVRQAETVLGAALFDRTTRSLVPTAAAHEAVPIALRVLQEVALLGDTFQTLHDRERGRVDVAATPAVGTALLPPLVRRFRERYPGIRLVLHDCAPEQFLPLVTSGEVDFGIGTPKRDDPEVLQQPLILRKPAMAPWADNPPMVSPSTSPLPSASQSCPPRRT
jgi:DNA-binding transcriptional LysR family regulator